MYDNIIVGIADYKVTKSPNKLVTLGLGSCIGICIYDTQNKIGGLAHIMLPCMPANNENALKSPSKYANTAIPLMIEEIIKHKSYFGYFVITSMSLFTIIIYFQTLALL